MSNEETKQRSNFQFSIINWNLIFIGGIGAFSLQEKVNYALLLIPVISFVLFCLWIHHAIAIRSSSLKIKRRGGFWQILRRITFSIAMLTNFILLPALALFMYRGEDTLYDIVKYIMNTIK
jgi:hypothetical protein